MPHDAKDVVADVHARLAENLGGGPVAFPGSDLDILDGIERLEPGDDLRRRCADLDEDRAAAPHELGEIGGRIGGLDFAAVDDKHAIAGQFDLGKNVGGKQDGVVAAQILNQVAYGADLVGVETDGRLIED